MVITCWDIDKSLVSLSNVAPLKVAGVLVSSVGVRHFSVNSSIGLDVAESVVHQSSVASVVAPVVRAVHEVLLAEGEQLSSLAEVLPFQGPCG